VAINACHQERPATIPLDAIAKVLTDRFRKKQSIFNHQNTSGLIQSSMLTIERVCDPEVGVTDRFPLSFLRRYWQKVFPRHLPINGRDASLRCWELYLLDDPLDERHVEMMWLADEAVT
jgi:hypothetical protein